MPVTCAPANLGEIERKPAPAAADVEHRGAGLVDAKLGREVALLGELGIVERLVGRLEIGAAILLVAVEEERIEPAVEVVVVRDVVAGAGPRIELLQAAEQIARPAAAATPNSARRSRSCRSSDREHVGNRALLDDEACRPYRLRRASARDRAGLRAARLPW